jgi:2-keto-4-pentenoate hydratase
MRVMSGSFTRQYRAEAGMKVVSRYTPFGDVSAEFI